MRWWRVFRVEFLLSTGVHQKNFPIFFVGQPIGNRRPGVAPASLRGSMYSNNFGTHDRMAQIPRDGCTVQCKCDFQSINNKTRTAFRFFFFLFLLRGSGLGCCVSTGGGPVRRRLHSPRRFSFVLLVSLLFSLSSDGTAWAAERRRMEEPSRSGARPMRNKETRPSPSRRIGRDFGSQFRAPTLRRRCRPPIDRRRDAAAAET